MTVPPRTDGALEFARFAYPPNSLGLCGPGDAAELLELAAAVGSGEVADADRERLRMLAGGFDGAWPYLQLIAAANHRRDPLDVRVVRAYWLGGELLDAVAAAMLGDELDDRFRRRAGRHRDALATTTEFGAVPHHNFHVFCVYPWVGLLRHGAQQHALRVLDRCRVRWGTVEAITGESAVVSSRPLVWDGTRLELGTASAEQVTWQRRGYALIRPPDIGDTVAMHWDWLARPITRAELNSLRRQTARHLAIANRSLATAPLTR